MTQQPTITYAHVGAKPNNYLVLSIINMLFCFFILGLIALIFSFQVYSNIVILLYIEIPIHDIVLLQPHIHWLGLINVCHNVRISSVLKVVALH